LEQFRRRPKEGGGITKASSTSATKTSLTVVVPSDAVSGAMQVTRVDLSLGSSQFPERCGNTAASRDYANFSELSGLRGRIDSDPWHGLRFDAATWRWRRVDFAN